MENEIVMYAASYLTARMAIVLLFGYALFSASRSGHAKSVRSRDHALDIRKANVVPDDRC